MSDNLKNGQFWLTKLEGALVPVVKFMALRRYGVGFMDIDARVSDALVALVEGANRFEPQPQRDGIGYFLQYTLSYVAGSLRNGATHAKAWSDEAVCFTDIKPDALGIDYIWETLPGGDGEEPDETQFVLNNGKVASTLEIIELVTSHPERRRIAAKALGIQADDQALPVRLLQALESIEGMLTADPRWPREPESPSPVVTHELEAVTVIRNGVQTEMSAAEATEAVEAASRTSVVWSPEETGVQYESDAIPWVAWEEGDRTRAYRSPYLDDSIIPERVARYLQEAVVNAWAYFADICEVMNMYPSATAILTALEGSEVWLSDAEQYAVDSTLALAEMLADESDGCANTVALWLAEEITSEGLVVNSQGRMLRGFRELFGLDYSGWSEELPSAASLRPAVERWVRKACACQGVWPSQKAAIHSLVLSGASPFEARSAARAAYSSARAGA